MSTDEKQAKEYAEKWQPTDGQAQRYIIQGYFAGLRSKEERIIELEKENAELKKQCDILDKSLITSTNNNIKRQKIIDELKEKLEHRNCVDCSNYGSNIKILKAKEIIKKFLLWENNWHKKTESKYELLKQAEQFLKERD